MWNPLKKKAARVPESIRTEVQCYVISGSTGTRSIITVGGRCQLGALTAEGLAEFERVACKTVNEAVGCNDARPMTFAEVEAYRQEEEDDKNERGELAVHEKFPGRDKPFEDDKSFG